MCSKSYQEFDDWLWSLFEYIVSPFNTIDRESMQLFEQIFTVVNFWD